MGNLQNRFGEIQTWLWLSDKQKAEVLSLNRCIEPGRKYNVVWSGLGPVQPKVYRVEVPPEEYWVYTSEEGDKVKVEEWVRKYGWEMRGQELVKESKS